ncbi:MAG: xanthine dehydrogenase family protein molybdopterin-binding subunit [Ekhidna sp.]
MPDISRRNFLKVSSLAGGGLLLTFGLPVKAFQDEEVAEAASALNSYLSIDTDGNIIFTLTKHEMGQGSGTGLPMILADELGADWSKLSLVRSDYDTKFSEREMGTTGGSGTIYKMWGVLRNAGATARELLRKAAANRWNVALEHVEIDNSYAINKLTGDQLEFGALAQEASGLTPPEEVELKKNEDFKYIGQPVRNLITDQVAVGKANYGINFYMEGMVYASIEKCPVYKGKLISYDDTETRKVKGVIDVIPFPSLEPINPEHHVQEGVAVIATSTWAAFQGRKKLKINWDEGEHARASVAGLSAQMDKEEKPKEARYSQGNLKALESDEEVEWVEYTYDNPYQAHALMEPINGSAYFDGDKLEVWVGTQSGERMSLEAEIISNLPTDKITIHVQNSGGSFGRRFYADSTMEAVYLAMKLKKPVKVTWTREDEITHDYFHPFQRTVHKAAIKNNEVVGWETNMLRTEFYFNGVELWEIPYDFTHIETYSKSIPSIIHVGAWRSVGEHSSALGREAFLDELAEKVGMNPLSFRLKLLEKPVENLTGNDRIYAYRKLIRDRFRLVLNEIDAKGWMKAPKAAGEGRGLAIGSFSRTVVAHVVDVKLDDTARNGFRVTKVRSMVMCGTLVNPHFGRGQIEGSVIWALSAVYNGGVEVENGRVNRSNFHDNILLRIDETPEMEIHFIPSDEPPTGLGEPATPPLAPAVVNALYDATGVRIRKIPVLKNDLMKELSV